LTHLNRQYVTEAGGLLGFDYKLGKTKQSKIGAVLFIFCHNVFGKLTFYLFILVF